MCQYCEETEVWEEPWDEDTAEDEGPYQCEWIDAPEDEEGGPYEDEDEDEDYEQYRCPEQAGHAIAERYVHQHLCAEHREEVERELAAGLSDLLEQAGLQQECEFLPIPAGAATCEYVHPVENLDPGGDTEECSRPAGFAQRIVSTSFLCDAHAAVATALEEA